MKLRFIDDKPTTMKSQMGTKLSDKMIVTLKECYNIQCSKGSDEFLFGVATVRGLIYLRRRGFIDYRKCMKDTAYTSYVTQAGKDYLKSIGYI